MIKKKNPEKTFSKGDFVVYPSYGLGKIKGIQNENIAGKRIRVFIISINERVILRVPAEKIYDLGLVLICISPVIIFIGLFRFKNFKSKIKNMYSKR